MSDTTPREGAVSDGVVTLLAGTGRRRDQVDDLVHLAGFYQHLDLDLGDELHLVLRAPERLRLAALAPVTLDLADGEADQAGPAQGLLHLLELEGLDDGGDQ